jgi:hypothetical protein
MARLERMVQANVTGHLRVAASILVEKPYTSMHASNCGCERQDQSPVYSTISTSSTRRQMGARDTV